MLRLFSILFVIVLITTQCQPKRAAQTTKPSQDSLSKADSIKRIQEKIKCRVKQNANNVFYWFRDFAQIHIAKTKIDFKEIPLKPRVVKRDNIDPPIVEKVVWSMNEELGLEHWFMKGGHLTDVQDSLFFRGQLLYKYLNIPSMIRAAYSFSFHQKDYLLFLYEYFGCNGIRNFYYHPVVLIDITELETPKSYQLGDCHHCTCGSQLRMMPDYLGDFNQDGQLDYINWKMGNIAHLYTFTDNGMEYLRDHYLVFDQITIPEPWKGEHFEPSCKINMTKSKWFYELPTPKTQDSCTIDIHIHAKYDLMKEDYQQTYIYQ